VPLTSGVRSPVRVARGRCTGNARLRARGPALARRGHRNRPSWAA